MTALLERQVSGKGQHVSTSLLQAQIFMLDFQSARWLIGNEVPGQAGNNHPTGAPTGVFRTSDGYINIAATGNKIWARLGEALGKPEMTKNPDYANDRERVKHRDQLNAEIEALTLKRTSAAWVELLNEAGVPCGPIYNIGEVFSDPQVKHLKIAQTIKGKQRNLTMAAQPFGLSRTPSKLVKQAPDIGADTKTVLKEFGFTKKQIADLEKAKAI
jgi:formyl-CoA transferase